LNASLRHELSATCALAQVQLSSYLDGNMTPAAGCGQDGALWAATVQIKLHSYVSVQVEQASMIFEVSRCTVWNGVTEHAACSEHCMFI